LRSVTAAKAPPTVIAAKSQNTKSITDRAFPPLRVTYSA
jgi:hypothetical protein